MKRPERSSDMTLVRAITRWFRASGRELPWRVTPRNPYLSLVSEFMLQQTQISRVLERFPTFIDAFPSLPALAAAPLDHVLSHWSGLGYYRRARNLHASANDIAARFNGQIPKGAADLQSLPGIGRYTAGALSSIAFNQPAPIVDGNVARVLMRIRGKPFAHASPDGLAWAWSQAEQLVQQAASPAAFNEGLMELGAVICTPRAPRCSECPVSEQCVAYRDGTQGIIPRPKVRAALSRRYCEAVLITDRRGRLLVEQRPDTGMWAGLWQAPTWERSGRAARPAEVADWIGAKVTRRDRFIHMTTHREIRFSVWITQDRIPAGRGRSFESPSGIARLALSSPQRRILLAAR